MMRMMFLAAMAIGLGGCEMVADQVEGQVRDEAVARCEAVAENAGVAADAVTPMCGCVADTLAAKDMGELAQVDAARIEEILQDCANAPASDGEAAQVENMNG